MDSALDSALIVDRSGRMVPQAGIGIGPDTPRRLRTRRARSRRARTRSTRIRSTRNRGTRTRGARLGGVGTGLGTDPGGAGANGRSIDGLRVEPDQHALGGERQFMLHGRAQVSIGTRLAAAPEVLEARALLRKHLGDDGFPERRVLGLCPLAATAAVVGDGEVGQKRRRPPGGS